MNETRAPRRLLHLVNVRTVGGVERIFADFVAHPPPFPVQHFTVADHRTVAPTLAQAVHRHSQIFGINTFAGLPVPRRPKILRAANRERLIRELKPDLILIWNQFIDVRAFSQDSRWPCPALHYEHGGAWYQQAPALAEAFFRRIDGVIAVSQAARRTLQLKYQITQPVDVCLNALSPGVLPARGSAKPRTLKNHRPLILGGAGRLVPVKCFGLLVLTVKALRARGVEAEAIIAGTGAERAALEALIAREGLQGKIRLVGLLYDMAAFYKEIDLYVSTSMREPFGLTCIEAAAWGVPVIAAAIDGLPEAVREGVTGICIKPTLSHEAYHALTQAPIDTSPLVYWPDEDRLAPPKMLDPEMLADAVLRLTSDPDYYRQMSAQAVADIAARGDFGALCDDLYRIMARYLDRKS
ncbi:MAG: glycosyltransferase [Proteobacteria bacterium]|nr:glycosyltransferase [Pseudomonadota bacterium]MCL2307233.1 glycosyltransferase [Pseudomonadota bacterium]